MPISIADTTRPILAGGRGNRMGGADKGFQIRPGPDQLLDSQAPLLQRSD